jgi:Ulp1 family protease
MRDVPQQSNAVDCGVYVMAMERALALNSALCINPSNSANFRSLLALCLKQCTLAPSIDASSM